MWNTVWKGNFFDVIHILFTCLSRCKISHACEIIMWKTYEYCVKITTISHGISHVWCLNLSDRACETLSEKDNIFHTLFHIVFTPLSHGKISHACGISCEISVKNMSIPCENYHFFTHYFTWFFTRLLLVVLFPWCRLSSRSTLSAGFPGDLLLGLHDLFILRYFQRLVTEKL